MVQRVGLIGGRPRVSAGETVVGHGQWGASGDTYDRRLLGPAWGAFSVSA